MSGINKPICFGLRLIRVIILQSSPSPLVGWSLHYTPVIANYQEIKGSKTFGVKVKGSRGAFHLIKLCNCHKRIFLT